MSASVGGFLYALLLVVLSFGFATHSAAESLEPTLFGIGGADLNAAPVSLPDDNDMIVIRPAGHFQDGTASSVVLQDGGVMVLDGEALTGRFVSPVLPVDEFDGVMFSMRSDVPDGTVIVVFI